MQYQLATPSPVRQQPAKRRGFNLVEAAIVLGVVGLVIGGIWVAASSIRQKTLINDVTQFSAAILRIAQANAAVLASTDGTYALTNVIMNDPASGRFVNSFGYICAQGICKLLPDSSNH